MKNFLSFLILSIITCQTLQSQQYLGGEIRWDCLSNGRFKFNLNLYKSCAGDDFKDSLILHSNSPAGDITLYLDPDSVTGITDVSPICNPDTSLSHIICDSNDIPGAVKIAYYTSDQIYPTGIILNGVPPASGWKFFIDECCRHAASNISDTGNFYLEAKMFPYNNVNVYPCFDDSPEFGILPITALCSGFPGDYFPFIWDRELDSIYFEWTPALTDSGQLCNYVSGYSLQLPFGVPVSLNPDSGKMIFDSLSTGLYSNAFKMTAYKAGIKVAENTREITTAVLPCSHNNNPEVLAPFVNPQSGQFTSFTDTVYVGEYLNFPVTAIDNDTFHNGLPQTICLTAQSRMFGNNFSSTTSGCLNPPCATLFPVPPLSDLASVTDTFKWQVECPHLSTNIGCGKTNYIYHFVFKVIDDFCPVPAAHMVQLTLVVLPFPGKPTQINCVTVDSAGNIRLNIDTVYDPFGTFGKHEIYVSDNLSGPFNLLDSITDPNQTVYLDTISNSIDHPLFYYIQSFLHCFDYTIGDPTDTIGPIYLQLSHTLDYNIQLNWNDNYSPTSSVVTEWFHIYRKQNPGNWILLDSTQILTYVDSTFSGTDTLYYKIETNDSLGCASVSVINNIIPQFAGIRDNLMDEARLLMIHPNPVSDKLNITSNFPFTDEVTIKIFDIQGRLIDHENVDLKQKTSKITLDVQLYKIGIYYYTISLKHEMFYGKFVVTNE
ncbi:T9SS type A sorting domain-containing protein [Bacteroidota bacterium]